MRLPGWKPRGLLEALRSLSSAGFLARLPGRLRSRLAGLIGLLCLLILLLILALGRVGNRAVPPAPGLSRDGLVPPGGPALLRIMRRPRLDFMEPAFPLARERKTRYTIEDVERQLPELADDWLENLRQQRKAQLDSILQAVD